MTYSIVISRYQTSKKPSKNSVKDITARRKSKQFRYQAYESKRNSEKIQEEKTYRSKLV
jgi:hypothetical protein